MGLNDSFSQVRGRILLVDQLPQINNVFALISQEENQRKISTQIAIRNDSNGTVAFALKTDNSKVVGNSGSYNTNSRFGNA